MTQINHRVPPTNGLTHSLKKAFKITGFKKCGIIKNGKELYTYKKYINIKS